MPKLTILEGTSKKEIHFDGTIRLSEILQKNLVSVPHPCACRGICEKCTVNIDGENVLSCKYFINKDTTVVIPSFNHSCNDTIPTETVEQKDLCLCLDIGTTTLALALADIKTGEILKTETRANRQTIFGADVISRIEYCAKNGVHALTKSIINDVNSLINSILANFQSEKIERLYVSGNTTMLHIFFGVDCTSIGISPYTPTFLSSMTKYGSDMGIEKTGEIISLPNISAFVGADIVAGLNYVKIPNEKYSILIDLGTNAEIALFNKDTVLCTTAAAGPCFEGVNIICGMSAISGAICSYTKERGYETIGNKAAQGICATGLIDIIAEHIRCGDIDENGYLEEKIKLSESVCLYPKDVREFQLAKSAVRSALEFLLNFANIGFEKIEKIYIAGGFSQGINIKNAIFTGLLPNVCEDKFETIQNSSLLGTVKFAKGENNLDFLQNAKFVDISKESSFSEKFFEYMCF